MNEIWLLREIVLPALDIGILAFLIYRGYCILVQTRAMQLIRGLMIMVFIYITAFLLQLETLLWILNLLVPGIVIGVAIVFQPELRKIFTQIGRGNLFRMVQRTQNRPIEAALNAASVLSTQRRGTLIVFGRSVGLKSFIDSGTRLDARVSSSLLLSIFRYDTPLHDGAVIIQKNTLTAAGCFLPLSKQSDIQRSFGTRHRAALGAAEESDAVVLVVSEETGAISLAYDENLHYDLTAAEIRQRLNETLGYRDDLEVPETGEEPAGSKGEKES